MSLQPTSHPSPLTLSAPAIDPTPASSPAAVALLPAETPFSSTTEKLTLASRLPPALTIASLFEKPKPALHTPSKPRVHFSPQDHPDLTANPNTFCPPHRSPKTLRTVPPTGSPPLETRRRERCTPTAGTDDLLASEEASWAEEWESADMEGEEDEEEEDWDLGAAGPSTSKVLRRSPRQPRMAQSPMDRDIPHFKHRYPPPHTLPSHERRRISTRTSSLPPRQSLEMTESRSMEAGPSRQSQALNHASPLARRTALISTSDMRSTPLNQSPSAPIITRRGRVVRPAKE